MKHWLAVACLGALAQGTHAQVAPAELRAQRDRIEADYTAALRDCSALSGNARNVCRVQARGAREVARAELEWRRDASARNEARLRAARADAAYRVALQRCADESSGPARQACRRDAQAAFVNARQ